jgi:hypothetical protein
MRDNPIYGGEGREMRKDKYNRMMQYYDGHQGPWTVKSITSQIPAALFGELTGRQLGLVMQAVNNAYHNGRHSTGAEMIDSNAVWLSARSQLVEVV